MVYNLSRDNTFCVISVSRQLGQSLLDGSFNPGDHQIIGEGLVQLTVEQSVARFTNNIFCDIEVVDNPYNLGYFVIVRKR